MEKGRRKISQTIQRIIHVLLSHPRSDVITHGKEIAPNQFVVMGRCTVCNKSNRSSQLSKGWIRSYLRLGERYPYLQGFAFYSHYEGESISLLMPLNILYGLYMKIRIRLLIGVRHKLIEQQYSAGFQEGRSIGIRQGKQENGEAIACLLTKHFGDEVLGPTMVEGENLFPPRT